MPLDLGDDAAGLVPGSGLITEAGMIPAHVLGRPPAGSAGEVAAARMEEGEGSNTGSPVGGEGRQRLAPEMAGQALATVDAAAMQIAVAGVQQAQPLGPAGAAQPQLNPGKRFPDATARNPALPR